MTEVSYGRKEGRREGGNVYSYLFSHSVQLFQTSSEACWTVSHYLALGEGLNERAGSAEARPGRTLRL